MTFEELCEKYPDTLNRFKVLNAEICDVTLSNADHNMLTVCIGLKLEGGMHQGFGSYMLHHNPEDEGYTLGVGYAGHFIWRSMSIAGVHEWSKLRGRPIRALEFERSLIAIGHYLDDDWFCPRIDFAEPTEGGI